MTDTTDRMLHELASTHDTPPRSMWIKWLFVWIDFVIVFSLVTLLWPPLSEKLFNLVLFGDSAQPAFISPEAKDYLRLTICIFSALTVGWLVMMSLVVHIPFRRGERWAWVAVAGSITTWFVLDSVRSIATGFPENALLNIAFVAGVVPPLVATRPRR